MRFVIQRVQHASVTVDEERIGNIGHGFLVLIGVSQSDTREIADKMIKKLIGLRIFKDENGKTNLDLKSVNRLFNGHNTSSLQHNETAENRISRRAIPCSAKGTVRCLYIIS